MEYGSLSQKLRLEPFSSLSAVALQGDILSSLVSGHHFPSNSYLIFLGTPCPSPNAQTSPLFQDEACGLAGWGIAFPWPNDISALTQLGPMRVDETFSKSKE